jgi:hypothetical protein
MPIEVSTRKEEEAARGDGIQQGVSIMSKSVVECSRKSVTRALISSLRARAGQLKKSDKMQVDRAINAVKPTSIPLEHPIDRSKIS